MRYLHSIQNIQPRPLSLAIASALASLAFGNVALAGNVIQTTTIEYDPVTGFKTAEVREPDSPQLHLRTAYTYDKFGNRLTTAVSSNATGLAAIAPRTVETKTWDASGRAQASSTNALGQAIYGGFDVMNTPTYINNLNGITSTFQFDVHSRKTSETRPDGTKLKWTYEVCTPAACPLPTAKYVTTQRSYDANSVENGPWHKTYFDELGRVVRLETLGFDGVSVIMEDTEYDALKRISRKSHPYYKGAAIQWTTNTWDALGRLIIATSPDNRQVKTSYNGLSSTMTNALNQTRTMVANALGQPLQIIDNQSNILSYQYDVTGNLAKTTDPKGNVTSYRYDSLGRKIGMTDPDLGNISYTVNALGQMRQQLDAKNNLTTINYDLVGRMINRAEADLVSTWTWDSCSMGKGRLCKVTSDNGYISSYAFDSIGRPRQTDTTIDVPYSIATTYDSNGRLATQSYPTGLTLKYVYTPLGYLKEVRNNSSNALYWQANAMDAEGHLVQQTYGNNVVTNFSYEAATDRVKSITAGAANGVQNLSFSYDARGNMFARTDANQNLAESFLYDTLNRVTSNTVNSSGVGQLTQTYGYDNIGDITSRSDVGTYTYGPVNNHPHAVTEIALAAGGKRQFSYDANGNLVQEVQRDALGNIIPAKGRSLSWTSYNMVQSITTPNTSVSFVYGPQHQRIKEITPQGTTYYVHPDNAGDLMYEKEVKPGGVVEHRQFVTAGGGVVAMIKQTGGTSQTLYMHRDHLGSTTAISNESGAVIERLAYEPFGKRRAMSGALDPNNTIMGVNTDRGYTNQEHLDTLGLINMNGRVYDPAIGRFVSADPNIPHAIDPQSYNRYSYVRNNPLITVDPTGFLDFMNYSTGDDFGGDFGGWEGGGWEGGGWDGGGWVDYGGWDSPAETGVMDDFEPVNNGENNDDWSDWGSNNQSGNNELGDSDKKTEEKSWWEKLKESLENLSYIILGPDYHQTNTFYPVNNPNQSHPSLPDSQRIGTLQLKDGIGVELYKTGNGLYYTYYAPTGATLSVELGKNGYYNVLGPVDLGNSNDRGN